MSKRIFCFEVSVKVVEPPSITKLKEITCVLLGHSRIMNYCFGECSCARCNEVIHDTFEGPVNVSDCVFMEHDCARCRANYKKLSWKDKIFTPYPFPR